MNKDSNLTRIHDYIKATLPWAQGLQLNALTTFVAAILTNKPAAKRGWRARKAIRKRPANSSSD